jgi:hypothetical protein
MGEPFNEMQQRVVLAEALRALCTLSLPGEIVDLPYRWRRQQYASVDINEILSSCPSRSA